ncbi:hypothetical protein [Streptomyces sp. NPDC048191]|uniref:hypothetical protein n=1 Tax=Streptomyces sp. NPDC048191 TaxID=3155484 RepID=UPI0033FF3534
MPLCRQWLDDDPRASALPDHAFQHVSTMARLYAADRYDRQADGMEQIGAARRGRGRSHP